MRFNMQSLNQFLVIALLAVPVLAVNAQDKKNEPAKPKPEFKVVEEGKDEKPANPQAAWKKLLERRLALFTKLQQLKKDFDQASDRSAKEKIRQEYVDQIREFEVDVYPQMLELAETIYKEQPEELDAGEIVMQKAFNENQYEKSAEIAAQLLAANRKTKSVLSTAGVSQFALHNFEDAHTLLSDAQKENKLEPQFATFVEAAQKYGDLWKKEQEIREKESALEGEQALPRVSFETNKGQIVFELFEDQAPNTVANFVSLVEAKKYDGVKFHRVIPTFMAQGGDPNTLNDDPSDDGRGGPGYTIKCECYSPDARLHFRGSLSMAHAGKDSGGSQFFITHLPTDWLNPATEPEQRGHTVFGRVVEGMEVAAGLRRGDKIEKAVVIRKRPHEYKPETKPDPDAKKGE